MFLDVQMYQCYYIISHFSTKCHCHWLFFCVHQHSYLLHFVHFVVVSDLHQNFNMLGRHFFPQPQRNPVFLWILSKDGNAMAAAEDMEITRSKIDIKFRKILRKNFQQKHFFFDTEHSIGFSDKLLLMAILNRNRELYVF